MKLNELTILETIDGLKSKKFTSVEVTKACFEQIKKYDSEINAMVLLCEDLALADARAADELITTQGISVFDNKPLLGVPYVCKDNFNTKGIETTASSNVLKGYIPPYESTVTQKLKEAGAILLGKTNMDAFAHGSSTETSDFFTTKNPWDKTRVPGGSSGGSGAAVAAHMCIFALGSETAGSIRCPAAWCGVTGFKPTYGRTSRYGVIAMASSTDQPGPIAKNIEDCALIMQIISGKDPLDATSSPKPVEKYLEVVLNAEPNLKGVRVGRPKSYFEIDLEPDVKKRVDEAIEVFRKLGAEIVEMDLMDPKYSIAVYTILQRSEVSSNLARLDGIRYGHDRQSFGFEARKRMMLGAYTLSSGYYDAYYSKAQKVRTLIIEDFNKAFSDVDMIIGPTMPCTALKIGESEKSSMFGEIMDVLTEPSSIAGVTALNLPCGFDSQNLPVGVQLIGQQFEESKIFKAASAFQKSTDFHKKFPLA